MEPPECTGGANVQACRGVNDPLGMLVGAMCGGGLPAEITSGGMRVCAQGSLGIVISDVRVDGIGNGVRNELVVGNVYNFLGRSGSV